MPVEPTVSSLRVVVVEDPAEELIAVSELKTYLHLDVEEDDATLLALLRTARQVLEGITGRCCSQTKFTAYLDKWPLVGSYIGACQSREIELPRAPLLAVDDVVVESVKYLDEDEQEQTLDDSLYQVEPGISKNWFGRIRLKQAADIPVLGDFLGALRITFYAGHGEDDVELETMKTAIKQLAGHMHTNPVPVNIGNIVNEVPLSLKFLIENLTVSSLK